MTAMDRAMRYLSTITNVHMDSRPCMLNTETGMAYPISTFKDLRETLALMERGGGNIRAYIAEWYNKVFTPAFKSLDGQPRVFRSEYGGVIAAERCAGLTTEELAEKTKEVYGGQKPASRQIRESYLYPLVNQGVINYSRSQINGQENIYFPVGGDEEDSIFSFFENSEDLRLKITDPIFYPNKNVLEKEFRTIVKQEGEERIENDKFSSKYKILDIDGNELTTRQLLDRYFDPESCFVRQFSDDQMYHSDSNITTINNMRYSHQQQLIIRCQDQSFQNMSSCPPLDLQKFSNNLSEEISDTCTKDTLRSCLIPTTATIVNSQFKSIRRGKVTVHIDFPPNCYYCNSKPDSTSDYETHVVIKHSGKPAYPGPADIVKYTLKKQGMPWEDKNLA